MMDPQKRPLLDRMIEHQMRNFDREFLALRTRRGPDYNYHTNVRNRDVHMIRESFYLALMLLDRQKEGDAELAGAIIGSLLDYQELNPDSPLYGIWPYYIEEPLAEMGAVDRNWADFCGKSLIQAVADYGFMFPKALMERMLTAVEAAATAITRRNVLPSYTNICVMGVYVTLLAGEITGKAELLQYGRDKLKSLHEYCMYHGAFTEYNSPTYTLVVIEDLSLILRHVKDEKSLALIRELHDMAWAMIASHYHAPTGQWAGPHSRSYDTLQGKSFLSFLQLASGGRLHLLDESDVETGALAARAGLHMPEVAVPYFQGAGGTSYTVTSIVKGKVPITAASYMSQAFTLGSFNHCDLWNQRRALSAYWGTPGRAGYLRFRCLHDGYDFSSGLIHTVQHRNKLIGIANLCTDHGDKHFHLDPIQGTLEVSSLLYRFELGGEEANIVPVETEGASVIFLIRSVNVVIGLVLAACAFDSSVPRIQVKKENGLSAIDVVLCEGEAAQLDLGSLTEAYLAFGLVIEHSTCSDEEMFRNISSVQADVEAGIVRIQYADEFKELELTAPVGPHPFKAAMQNAKGTAALRIEKEAPVWSV